MTVPAKNASPAPVVSITFTFLAGTMPLSPSAQAYSNLYPHGNNCGGCRRCHRCGQRAARLPRPHMNRNSSKDPLPAGCRQNQSICCKKSRRSIMLMLSTAYTFFNGISAAKIQDLLYSVFFQIKFNGNAIAVANSSYFSASRSVRGLVSGRLEWRPTTSPHY